MHDQLFCEYWKLTQFLGSGYSPPVMVVHIVEVGSDS